MDAQTVDSRKPGHGTMGAQPSRLVSFSCRIITASTLVTLHLRLFGMLSNAIRPLVCLSRGPCDGAIAMHFTAGN